MQLRPMLFDGLVGLVTGVVVTFIYALVRGFNPFGEGVWTALEVRIGVLICTVGSVIVHGSQYLGY